MDFEIARDRVRVFGRQRDKEREVRRKKTENPEKNEGKEINGGRKNVFPRCSTGPHQTVILHCSGNPRIYLISTSHITLTFPADMSPVNT